MVAFCSNDPKMLDAFMHDRDIYATIAALSFNSTYEECLEFNPITGENQPEGKERRSQAKKIVLGILYGRSIKSIGEQLFGGRTDMTEDDMTREAQKIYDAVLNAFPNLRAFMDFAQQYARDHGYVETILGRRRHIPDMQLPMYEFHATKKYVNPDIDPLDPKTLVNKNEIPTRVIKQLQKEFANYKYMGQVYRRIKDLDENDHIKVVVNKKKIQDASRKCVNCVDTDTEILTRTGWKRYNEVMIGDEILSYSMETNMIVMDVVNEVFYYPEVTDTVRFKTQTFDVVSTHGHRWVVGEYDHKPRIKTTEDLCNLKWPYPILRVSSNQFVDNPSISDLELKLLGWLMTDGSLCSSIQGVQLYQSCSRPKNTCVYKDMLTTLDALGFAYTDTIRNDVYHDIYIKKNDFTSWVSDTFSNRILSWEFVGTLSQRQAEILMRSMLQGDGTGVDGYGMPLKNHRVSLCCRNRQAKDIFQYLCFIAGYATNCNTIDASKNDYPSNHKQYDSMMNIPVSNSTYYDVSILKVKRAHVYPHQMSNVKSIGTWCVSTGQGTWVARRNGKVFITGNSIIQGSSAELTKIAMLKVFNNPEWNALGGRVILQVHDELIAEIPIYNWKRGGELLSSLMSEAGSFLPFPINCDVTTTLRWYGLSYPCIYTKPEPTDVIDETLSPDKISWIQYHLFELEYLLPTFPNSDGSKLEGDAAVGVNGIWSQELSDHIQNYLNRYNICMSEFIDHIEGKVVYDTQL